MERLIINKWAKKIWKKTAKTLRCVSSAGEAAFISSFQITATALAGGKVSVSAFEGMYSH